MSNDHYDWPCYNCGSDGTSNACYACWSHVVPKLKAKLVESAGKEDVIESLRERVEELEKAIERHAQSMGKIAAKHGPTCIELQGKFDAELWAIGGCRALGGYGGE